MKTYEEEQKYKESKARNGVENLKKKQKRTESKRKINMKLAKVNNYNPLMSKYISLMC